MTMAIINEVAWAEPDATPVNHEACPERNLEPIESLMSFYDKVRR
jgi:hypothetical protein